MGSTIGLSALCITLLVLGGVTSPAAAQIDAPSLPTGGIFGRRNAADPKVVSQEMTVSLNAGLGQDRNTVPDADGDPLVLFGPQPSGRVGFGAASVHYRWGRDSRFLKANGGGYSSYASAGVNQVWNGSTAVTGAIDLNRRVNLSGGMAAEVAPDYLFETLPVGLGESPLTGADGLHPQGVTEQKWLSANTFAGLNTGWTSRQATSFRYSRAQTGPLEGMGFDSQSQLVTAHHSWKVKRTIGLQASYRFRDNRQTGEFGGQNTLLSHSVDAGVAGERRLFLRRLVTYSLAAGITHAEAEYSVGRPGRFALPNFSAAIGLMLMRSWLVSASSSRNVTVLEGFTPEPLAVTTTSIDVSGNLSRRFQLRTTGSYANGDSQSGAGAFVTSAASAHAQYALSRQVALFAGYGYYKHHLRNLIAVFASYPDRYQRHSVWVGTSVWLPVFGRF
jgi:hypothetical protein